MISMKLTYRTYSNGYTILNDGIPWITQNGNIPYPRPSYDNINLDLSAQAHIDALLKLNQNIVPNIKKFDKRVAEVIMKRKFLIYMI